MQELKSISTASGPTSELQRQKGVSGLAYDPLGEAVFMIKSGGSDEACPALLRIPDSSLGGAAWEHHDQALGTLHEEAKSLVISSFPESLASQRSGLREAACEAHPRLEPQYLPPQLIGETPAGKQIFNTNTYQEPDCLRFCTSNSSENIEISLSGFTVSAKAPDQVARTNKAFVEGVHYWEVICPISLSTLQIGVSNKSQKEQVTQQFRTTTPRVVGIELNLEKMTLNFWLNGRFIKERLKKIPAGHQWYPTIKFKESDYFVVINPFAQGRGFTVEEENSNYLPNSLHVNEISQFARYTTTALSRNLLVHGLNVENKGDKAQDTIQQEIKNLIRLEESSTVDITYKERKPEEETSTVSFAILKFKTEQESIAFYHKNKDLKLLIPRQIAQLIQPSSLQSAGASPTKQQEKSELPLGISSDVLELLSTSDTFNKEQGQFKLLAGLTADLTTEQLSKRLTCLKEAIEQGTVQKSQFRSHDKPQDETQVHYLSHPDKLLLVNGPEMKLITRENGQFPLTHQVSFTLYPDCPEANVCLDISLDKLLFLMTHIDWALLPGQTFDVMGQFFDICKTNNTHNAVIVPYSLGLIVVKTLLNIGISQYEQVEHSFESLQEQEILHKYSSSLKHHTKDKRQDYKTNEIKLPFEFGTLSVVDSHQLLSILLGLEDQLWAMIQSDQVPKSVKDLWCQRSSSRVHTAYGRLSSFITFPSHLKTQDNKLDLVTLSELGLVNTNDRYGKLQHFQEFRTELENIFQGPNLSSQELQSSLERQFPHNLMLKGLPSWNVPLSNTLNKLPPVVHENGLKSSAVQNYEKISSIKKLHEQDNIMTCGSDGSVNIWNVNTRLHKIAQHNFKQQLFQDDLIEDQLLVQLMNDNEILPSNGVRLIVAQSGASKKAAAKPSEAQELKQLEDILFTMFEESPDAGANGGDSQNQEDELESQKDEQEDLSGFLLDFYDQPSGLTVPCKPKAKDELFDLEETKEAVVADTAKKTEVPVTEKPVEQQEIPVEPDLELIQQLTAMGFTLELSKKGLIKVKNESVAAAIEVIMELQEAQSKKPATIASAKKLSIISYSCEICTFLNQDGKSVCDVCGAAAPQSAYVFIQSEEDIKKEKEEQEKKIKAEEEEINRVLQERLKLEEAEQKRIEDERIRIEKENHELRLKEQLKVKTKEYFEQSEIVNHLFASLRSGRDVKPLLSGVVFKNTLKSTHDIHIVRFGYKKSYLKQFVNSRGKTKPRCQICDVPFNTSDQCTEHLLQSHKEIVEGLYPVYIGSQNISKPWDIKSNRNAFCTMNAEQVATIVLPFEYLDHFCQIGSDILEDTPLYIVCIGRRAGVGEQEIVISKVQYTDANHELSFATVSEQSFLDGVGLQIKDIRKIEYCSSSSKLVIETASNKLTTFKVTVQKDLFQITKCDEINLSHGESLLEIQNGVVLVNSGESQVRRFLIDEKRIQEKQQRQNLQQMIPGAEMRESLSEGDILKMQIETSHVTANDIRRYEKLMSGKAVRALSNAQSMLNCENSDASNQKYFTKHHWIVNGNVEATPIELEFERPTSLISLNIEMTFNCRDTKQLLERINAQQIIGGSNLLLKGQSIHEKDDKIIDTSVDAVNLGLLSIHGQGGDNLTLSHQPSQNQSTDIAHSKAQAYIPLIVDHHKGASYNQGFQVCRIVMDNDKIFASNYPLPEFFFKHLHGHLISIDKFTVRSNPSSKCGAFPIGSGIIFAADHLSAFEKTVPFHRFSAQDYQEWRQERLKDPTPLRPFEPIAYFEFDAETQITFEPDCKRVCKYVFLKPTGFRKKPTLYSQKISVAPLEIEFFGVMGSSQEDSESTSGSSLAETESGLQEISGHQSKYELELRVLNESKVLKNLKGIEIQQLIGFDQSLSSRTLSSLQKPLDKGQLLTGKTILKITDSHIQLQEVKGLSLSLRNPSFDTDIWELRGISVQGVIAGQDDSGSQHHQALFNKPEIPLSYMRSCLLSPKFYNVVNRVLARIVSSDNQCFQLRATVIQFLNRLMKLDRDFVPLVLADIDLEQFLKINLFYGDSSGMQLVIEFLQNFQRDFAFCTELYNILLNYVDMLPQKFLSYNGYEALIGLLKWAVPINPERTLVHLMRAFYQQVCLNKVPQLQTNECISFRSRFTKLNPGSYNLFPFDHMAFKSMKHAVHQKKEMIATTADSSSRQILPVNRMKRTKFNSHHIFDVEMAGANLEVTDIKLFIGLGPGMENIQYKIILKILGETGDILYFNTFEEQIFTQFAHPIKASSGEKSQSRDSLHIPNLALHSQKIKVVIEYSPSFSSIPKNTQKQVNVESLIEIYGHSTDGLVSSSTLKGLLDKKAQEYWQNSAKLYSVGKSIQMLQIVHDQSESLLVPQGTQSSQSPIQEMESIQSSSGDQIQTLSQGQQSLHQDLELLQEELKGKLRANDPNIKEIVGKITHIQQNIEKTDVIAIEGESVVPSLEYYITIVSDFTKLIRTLLKSQRSLTQERVSKVLRDSDPNGDLSVVAFEVFKRFVVYDQGPQVKQDAQNFIIDTLFPVMTKDETRGFTFKIIEEFLSQPQSTYSQVAVLDSLSTLGIPEGELISFMIQKLNIGGKEQPQVIVKAGSLPQIQPFVFMSSVLILALNSLRQITVPEPGQALHKGVSCTSCHSKIIVGWRYKCGNCPGDVDFDEKCVSKHLAEHPDHVLLIIQEPLPYSVSSLQLKGQKHIQMTQAVATKPQILPLFEFKDLAQVEDLNAAMTHDDVNCENCGKKPIIGNLFKCANCEDYNLCEQCYSQNLYDHFSYHIFMKLHKPLKQQEKNPTTLMQLLDPRLYPSQSQLTSAQLSDQISPLKKKQENGVDEDDEDFDDLAPLSVSRSLSVPMSQKIKNKQPTQPSSKQQIVSSDQYEKLDCDQQFVVLFHTCVWITQDSKIQRFSKQEKIVLLKLTFDTMLLLIKLSSVKHLLEVISNKEAFFQLLVSVLQLNSKDLIQLFKNLFDLIRQPPSLQRRIKEDKIQSLKQKQDAKSSEKKQQLIEENKIMKKLLETLISHVQAFLRWLIDLGLDPDLSKLQALQGQESWNLLLQSYTNQRIWLDHLSLILEMFIKSSDELKEHNKNIASIENECNGTALEKIPEESMIDGVFENDEDLVPLSMARSFSLPLTPGQKNVQQQPQNQSLQLIKCLVQLLYINDPQTSSTKSKDVQAKQPSHFRETESQTKYLSQMWSLVLKSLTAVGVNQLIEAKIFDALVNAFLISTEEIQQITYPQILQITEIIATQSVHTNDISKFICNLLFITLENVTDNHHEKVGYSICQGWLDILISSSTSRAASFEASNTVHAKMNGEEVSVYLKKTSQYLISYLNKCSFEGVTGSNMLIMMRLNLASDLLYVIRHTEIKNKPGTLAIQDLVSQISSSPRLQKEFSESMSNLIAWLFLNARQAKDDTITSQLGNTSTLIPATSKVKQMTDHIQEIFALLAEFENNEVAIKIALSAMTTIVKRMNKTLLDLTSNNQLGFDLSIRLSERTNEYFIKLLGQWLVSDVAASYFVFDLGGFEFLLDTIGVGSDAETSLRQRKLSDGIEIEESKSDAKKVSAQIESDNTAFQSLVGSDLGSYLESTILEFQAFNKSEVAPIIEPQPQLIGQPSTVVQHYDKSNVVYVQELSKNMAMVSSNGGDVPATYSKTDWSVNKRAYKHRIIIKHIVGNLRPEYWILFQLPTPVELREIQIAFNNYWAADTEVYVEPLSVLVEAGMDENNLSLVCNLQQAKDDAFGSVSATVFGQNVQSFGATTPIEHSPQFIEDMIQSKLQSLQNFKVQFVKFRMRRNVLTCLENSPLSSKFAKQAAFAINYISLLGFELPKIGEYQSYIRQEQKKTALEVLSIICSGDFQSILKVIANQQQTIEKIKNSFNLLASLVSIKANLIEPTFIAISTYNTEMGDWIINQFLQGSRNYRHASLVGEIVICNKTEMPRRLNLLKDFVMNQLRKVTQEERSQHGILIKNILPFVKVFIQTLRIAAPDLESIVTGPCDLGTKESHLTDLIQLLSGATQERELQTKILTQLLILLLCPPAPFINSNIDAYEFALKHLIEEQSSLSTASEEVIQQRESIASILSATRSQIAQEILERGLKLDKLLNPGKGMSTDEEKVVNSPLQHCIKFWINVSQDASVKKKLAADKVPLKLYEILRSEHPEKSLKIIRKDTVIHEQELDLLIELIKQLTAGEPELERELASMLMKDLDHMSNIRDMNFVNKVFLQLLRIERTIPICLWPFDSENKKWLTTYKPEIITDQTQTQVSHNNFVPSPLLQGEVRSAFIKNFKEIVGQHSKGATKKLMASTWTCAHSQTEQGQVAQFQGFWKNIENKAPVVALISGTTSSGSNVVFGCYCSKGIPAVPSNFTQDSDYPVISQPEDFVFCYIDDTSFHHFATKTGVPIISMFTDYEGGGAISIANDFMLMSFSYDFAFTVGTIYDLQKIQEENNPKPLKEVEGTGITFKKFEVWSPQKSVAKEGASTITQLKATLSGPSVSTLVQSDDSLSGNEVKHAWYNSLSPFVHYRTNPVFMIPAHLTLTQLSKIMLESNVLFKARSHIQYQSTNTLEGLYEKLNENTTSFSQMNGIVDLEYEINQLLVGQQLEEQKENAADESEFSKDEGSSQVISGYVPKMGLFEQFEEQGGVKAIIQVTLQSLKLWKTEEQAKSWELWLRELESFSEIPLFFQLFLKNTRCKDLLFKVLAGLPDSEIASEGAKTEAKTKWEEEQKAAVQFNYKILSEAFTISTDLKLRDTAMKCGLLPRILDRLASISGEKPRFIEEEAATALKLEEEVKQLAAAQQVMQQADKNVDKKKRKGVGYASKVGQIFNVAQYLENKKQRNEQIKNLIDICSNFISSKEWKASEEVMSIILESALLPLLESAFRNGSWLDMAKEHEVYHSYLALARALAQQKNLIACLVQIDQRYKPTQTEPIYKLLQKLNDLAEIFINCLNQQTKAEQLTTITKEPDNTIQPNLTLQNLPPISIPQLTSPAPVYSQSPTFKELFAFKLTQPWLNNAPSSFPSPPIPAVLSMLSASYKHHEEMKSVGPDSALESPKSSNSSEENKKLVPQSVFKQTFDFLNQKKKEVQSKQPLSVAPPNQSALSDAIKTMISQDTWKQAKPSSLKALAEGNKNLIPLQFDNIDPNAIAEELKQSLLEIEELYKEEDATLFQPITQPLKTLDDAQAEAIYKQLTNEAQNVFAKVQPKKVNKKNQSQSSEYVTVSEATLNEIEDSDKQDSEDYETFSEESYDDEDKSPEEKISTINAKLTKLQVEAKKFHQEKAKQKKPMKLNKKYAYGTEDEEDVKLSDEKHSSSSSEQLDSNSDTPVKKKKKPLSKQKKYQTSSQWSSSHSITDSNEDSNGEEDPSDQSSESVASHPDVEEDNSSSGSYDTEMEMTVYGDDEEEKIANTAEIDSEIPENLAKDVIKTYKIVQAAIQKLLKNQKDDNFIENALNLPTPQSYKVLLQDLRFDYMDMKDPSDTSGAHFKHHYQQVAAQNQNPPPSKMVRLAQELADLSNALPYEHTNAIFVRVDQSRVDLMKALICGASCTPYAHGCYEYDIFCDNNYPRDPPKMNLITTGSGSVRFNPNLYACGKVCLSLLGTWRGSATENWDPKLSTILQVLLSTQAIIMSEEVYFNEPGFENEAGTPEGEKKNEGYQNIVRYCNIKFAMIGQLKRPSKGFEQVIKRHFYIKKEEILKEVNSWVELAEKNEAAYTGLVNDHNYNWANQFKASKTKFKEMLVAAVAELSEELNKLERPTDYELQFQQEQKKRQQQSKKTKRQAITEGKAELGEIDMDTDEENQDDATMINTESGKQIDIEDEAVKDRWSRYIGAMGVEAVAKQSAANIFLSGAGALGIEIAKNLVLAGCKSFTLHDYKPITYRDLSGQFFLNLEEDMLNEKKKKATRGEACIHRLRQLNYYVKCVLAPIEPIPLDEALLIASPWNFSLYDVIILTEATNKEIILVDEYCRREGKKLIVADAVGVFTRVFTDFGPAFEVLDKNGEELQDVMIKSIEADSENALVELLPHAKHRFEDGDEILITQVEGMKLKEGMSHEDSAIKSDSINETIHKVKVLTPYSFRIGDTRKYEKYIHNGIAKQLKTKKVMQFKSFKETMELPVSEIPLDGNLAVADFEKMQNNALSHLAFEALDLFRSSHNNCIPASWSREDTSAFYDLVSQLVQTERYKDVKPIAEWTTGDTQYELRFFSLFSLTAAGVFNPLCAFQGGVVAQECVKAITQKFTPIGQIFYYDAIEVLSPEFNPIKHLDSAFDFEKWVKEDIQVREVQHRSDGLRVILGGEMIQKLAHTRLFMVGAGAIGCELLKNYAMLGVGTGKAQPSKKLAAGVIVLTDPDVIEVSNLNRQFLFREKHLRKPKSSTAAAAAVYMNRELRDNIIARLDKVHEGTAHIFNDQFYEGLSVVTNALDNVHARRYIDARCVVARTPLLESGTLGPKGHVQVVLPHLTESYGSQNDPEDNTEIPHCTLKMFPEETLHCVEWARDKFGKLFTSAPQNALKLLDEGEQFVPMSQEDTKSLKEVIKLLNRRPKTFEDCIQYARIKFQKLFNHDLLQLLHVYPLDAKTKEGAPFWSLPKRPPTPVIFDLNSMLHCQFINAIACLRANVFKIEIPSAIPRSEKFRKECGLLASNVVVPEFVPNDDKAKEIQDSVNKETSKKEEEEEDKSSLQETTEVTLISTETDTNDVGQLMKTFTDILKQVKPTAYTEAKSVISPELFEKDNDQNFHIDAIYAMSNCRAVNYKLDPMDWITVKLKAGRIVPALATTTAAVAGLQTLELVKLLRGCKKVDHRNVFLNLAVPIMQASEPADVLKTKLTETIEVTLWDRWDVHGKDITLSEVIKQVQETHSGLDVRDVMRGNAPLYFHAIMNAPGKENEKEKTLGSKVTDLTGVDPAEDKYVDLNITCVRTGDVEDKILAGVPPVRVFFD